MLAIVEMREELCPGNMLSAKISMDRVYYEFRHIQFRTVHYSDNVYPHSRSNIQFRRGGGTFFVVENIHLYAPEGEGVISIFSVFILAK